MENYLVCKCKKVTVADIEHALHNLNDITDVVKKFDEVQKITHCSTGCGGCHDEIMDIISQLMHA